MSTSIMLLKAAAAADSGEQLGQAIKTSSALKAVGKAVRGTVRGAARAGGDLAEGLGGSRALGEAGGVAALGYGTYAGGKKVKQKKDQWLWQHGFAR